EAFEPTFCKVLVRYNPQGDRALNERQAARLKRLSDYLADKNRSRFMFELLVPPEKAQLDKLKGDKKIYDREVRPRLMVETIHELQDADVRASPPASAWLSIVTARGLIPTGGATFRTL